MTSKHPDHIPNSEQDPAKNCSATNDHNFQKAHRFGYTRNGNPFGTTASVKPQPHNYHRTVAVYDTVSDAFNNCLSLGTPCAWCSLHDLFTKHMTMSERYLLAACVLSSLNFVDAHEVAQQVLRRGHGMPLPPLFSYSDEAAFWVAMADPKERESYLLACFNAMPLKRQRAFLDFAQKGITS